MSQRHRAGLSAKNGAYSCWRSPKLSAALPAHYFQKPLKTNIYIPASRSAAPIVGANVWMYARAAVRWL